MRFVLGLASLAVLGVEEARAQPWVPTPQFQVTSDLAGALRGKDVAKALALFTDRAVLFPPSGETISGRTELEAFLKERVERGALKLAIVSTGSSGTEDIGFDSGTCEFTVTIGKEEPKQGRGTYVAVLRLVDGKWKIDRLIWNARMTIEPAGGPAAPSPAPGATLQKP
jgi:ketosteroid isomerase-like protein